MVYVYIIYSKKIDKYYIGSCLKIEERLNQHNENIKNGFTKRANDWELYFSIENLSYTQSRKIESFIKRMKSRLFIEKLKTDEDLVESIKTKFQELNNIYTVCAGSFRILGTRLEYIKPLFK